MFQFPVGKPGIEKATVILLSQEDSAKIGISIGTFKHASSTATC
jgi:hypothetical protein